MIEYIYSAYSNSNSIIEICNKAISEFSGNIIEIGAGYGEMTSHFLDIAKAHNVKTIVIDPFEDGWDNMPESYGKPYPFEKFMSNVHSKIDYMVLQKVSSHSEGLYEKLQKDMPYSFAFVDGLQYEWAVISDLTLMDKLNCKVICVDDYDRLNNVSSVPSAIDKFLEKNNNYELIVKSELKERTKAFLIKNK